MLDSLKKHKGVAALVTGLLSFGMLAESAVAQVQANTPNPVATYGGVDMQPGTYMDPNESKSDKFQPQGKWSYEGKASEQASPANARLKASAGMELSIKDTETGTAPFDSDDSPGHDSSKSNNVLRLNDWVTWTYQLKVTGGLKDGVAHIKHTLPDGLAWYKSVNDMPAYCDRSLSSISADLKSIDCGVKNIPQDSVQSYSLSAQATPAGKDQQVLSQAGDAVHATGVSVDSGEVYDVSTGVDPIRLSGAPKIDPWIDTWNTAQLKDNGVDGWVTPFTVWFPISDYQTNGIRGHQQLDGQTLKFVLDLTKMGANSRLATKDYQGGSDICKADWGANISCSAGVDAKHPVVVVKFDNSTGTDLRPGTSYWHTDDGRRYLAVGRVNVFTPYGDVPDQQSKQFQAGITQIQANAKNINGLNVANIGNDPSNDWKTIEYARRSGMGMFTNLKDYANATSFIPNQTNWISGDGTLVPGSQYSQSSFWDNYGTTVWTGMGFCNIIDPVTQSVTGASTSVESGYQPGSWIIEYSTSSAIVNKSANLATRQNQMNTAQCDDSKGWSTTKPVAPNDVTAVRYRPSTGQLNAGVKMQFNTDLEAKNAPQGTPVGVTFMYKETNSGDQSWRHSGDPYDMTKVPNSDAPRGDRAWMTQASIGVVKTAGSGKAGDVFQTKPGGEVPFTLKPYITAHTSASVTAANTTLKDRLPKGYSYVKTDTGPAPSQVLPQSDGTTILVWNLGNVTKGSEPVIKYTAKTGFATAGDATSPAIISSPSDSSSSAWVNFPSDENVSNLHYGLQRIQSLAPGGMNISKTVDKSVAELTDTLSYNLSVGNLTNGPQPNTQMVDVLPYNGDATKGGTDTGRSPVSSSVKNKVNLADWVSSTNSSQVYYTNAPSADVYRNTRTDTPNMPNYGTLPAGFKWCLQNEFGSSGCPTNRDQVTAVKVFKASLGAHDQIDTSIKLATNNQTAGNIYANDASAVNSDDTVGVDSEDVTSKIVATTLGEKVWEDQNKNGLNDNSEQQLPNIGVRLTGTDKNGTTIDRTTTTNSEGKYSFSDVVSGNYRIAFDKTSLPADASFTLKRQGSDNLVNSSVNPDGSTDDIRVVDPTPTGNNGVDLTWNAGISVPVHPAITTQTSTETAHKGDTITDTLHLTTTGGSWSKGQTIPVTSTLYRVDDKPVAGTTIPAGAIKVGEVSTTITGPGAFTTPGIKLDQSGYYVWMTNLPESTIVTSFTSGWNDPNELTFVQWNPHVATDTSIPVIGEPVKP